MNDGYKSNPGQPKSRNEQMYKSQKKRKKSDQTRQNFLFGAGILVMMIAICVVLFGVLFKIQTIEIVNSGERYSNDQISSVLGLKADESLYGFSAKKLSERLETQLPYIGFAQIKRVLPDKITVTVEYTKAALALDSSDGYCILNAEGKVLEKGVKNVADYIALVTGVSVTNAPLGENAEFEIKDMFDNITGLATEFESCGFSNITAYRLADLNQIEVEVDYKVTIKLGSIQTAAQKLQFGKAVIDDTLSNSLEGTYIIDLTNEGKAYVRDANSITPATQPNTTEILTEESTTLTLDEPTALKP